MKSNQESGVTLIEVLVAFVFIFVIGGVVFGGCSMILLGQGKAEENLASYSQRAGLQPIGCVGRDTDGDGYISCDAKDGDRIVSLQCSNGWLNSGCKIRPLQFNGTDGSY